MPLDPMVGRLTHEASHEPPPSAWPTRREDLRIPRRLLHIGGTVAVSLRKGAGKLKGIDGDFLGVEARRAPSKEELHGTAEIVPTDVID